MTYGIATACSALLLCACIAKDSVPEDDFVAAFVDARCAPQLECCKKNGYEHVDTDCAAAFTDSLKREVKAARAAHAVYDGIAARECVEETRRRARRCDSLKQDFEEPPVVACNEIYRDGQTAPGAECLTTWQCASTENETRGCGTVITETGREHRCMTMVTVREGDSVRIDAGTNTVLSCPPGLLVDDSGLCRGLYELGEHCMGPAEDLCAPGLVCDSANTRRCVTALPLGAECTQLGQCESFACRENRCVLFTPGLWCK